jgi:surfactin synthase thioesterase subunit
MYARTLTSTRLPEPAQIDDSWLVTTDVPESLPPLLIVPHAGAGAGAYRRLAHSLRGVARPLVVRLPGRETRIGEPAFTDIRMLVRALVPVVLPHLDDGFVLYGHSMGALIAFETARQLQLAYGLEAAHLIVSGMEAPGRLTGLGRRNELSDDELWDVVCGLGGMPPAIAKDPTMRELILPPLRADFEIVDRYTRPSGPALRCPVSSFAGRSDDEARPPDMLGWREETMGGFWHTNLPGDHFFNLDRASGFAEALGRLVADSAIARGVSTAAQPA